MSKHDLGQLWVDTLHNAQFGAARAYLQYLESHAAAYKAMIAPPGSINPQDVPRVVDLVRGLRRGTIAHAAGGGRHDGFDDFWRFYIWLPGNLFKGPHDRKDEPGDAMDLGAKVILRAPQHTLLSDLHSRIHALHRSPADAAVAKAAWYGIRKMASGFKIPRHFNAKNWEWNAVEGGPVVRHPRQQQAEPRDVAPEHA
ncbi:hypothetical protein [Streptomyces roseifaciens]|uniref:hypothetical protein n=1 Tax=Streptomyces roseifaciens TaxID=1488406 RepID=UPI0011876843|nr:hypothetical protein [Streptomyces roseifaciens]